MLHEKSPIGTLAADTFEHVGLYGIKFGLKGHKPLATFEYDEECGELHILVNDDVMEDCGAKLRHASRDWEVKE